MKLLSQKGLHIQRQVSIPIEFEGEHFDEGFRVDLFVEGKVIIELKSVEKIDSAHKKQLLTYLRLTNTKLGYILNFGAGLMKDGITRMVNNL
jgi:GxxExxY protein